ncbi:MAG: penicillin-binding protein 1C, partial [Bacteroidota bacterium]|nr:penicillin-binding protein 1C [Bacteroidota bacterium]
QSIKIVQDHSGQNKDINVLDEVKVEKWFVLPPAMEFYFRKYNPSYLSVPVNSISGKGEQQVMEFIYPGSNDKIYIPLAVDGKRGNVVFEVAHREASVKIFWHLDNQYIGTTSYIHQKALNPTIGQHQITLTDEHGNTLKRLFTILN